MCNPFTSCCVCLVVDTQALNKHEWKETLKVSCLRSKGKEIDAFVDSTAAQCYKSSIDLDYCCQDNTFQLWNPVTLIVQNLVIYKLFPHFYVYSCPKTIYRISDTSVASIPP
jgi:hypothetical protein